MRTLTDVSSKLRQVEVELTAGELAARLGYTGLAATNVVMENGIVRVHMQNVVDSAEWIGQERGIKHRPCSDRECCPICDTDTESDEEVSSRFGVDENSHY